MDIPIVSVGFVEQFKRMVVLTARRLSYDIYQSEPMKELFQMQIPDGRKAAVLEIVLDKLNAYFNLNLCIKDMSYRFNQNFDLQSKEEVTQGLEDKSYEIFEKLLNWKTSGITKLIKKTTITKWNTEYDYSILAPKQDKWTFQESEQIRRYNEFPLNKQVGDANTMLIEDEDDECDEEEDEINENNAKSEIKTEEGKLCKFTTTTPLKWTSKIETKKLLTEKYLFNIEIFNKSIYPNIKCVKSDRYWNNLNDYCKQKKTKFLKIVVLNGQPPPMNIKYHGIFDDNPYMGNWNNQVIILQGKRRKLVVSKYAQIDIIYKLLNEKPLPEKILMFCNWSVLYFRSNSDIPFLNENRKENICKQTTIFPKLDFTPIDLD